VQLCTYYNISLNSFLVEISYLVVCWVCLTCCKLYGYLLLKHLLFIFFCCVWCVAQELPSQFSRKHVQRRHKLYHKLWCARPVVACFTTIYLWTRFPTLSSAQAYTNPRKMTCSHSWWKPRCQLLLEAFMLLTFHCKPEFEWNRADDDWRHLLRCGNRENYSTRCISILFWARWK